ncbi:MAG TPA: zf-HC2 domain-containing protein [Chloroflexota bacterium]|nr:zf-HC2 domain-containing protein [Chloroflexota bacterium]
MTHDQIRDLLARRTELTPLEDATVQAHLEGCPECRIAARDYDRQMAALRSLPLVPPPPVLRDRIMAEIQRPPARRFRMVYGLGPLAAAAVIALGVMSFHHAPHPTASSRQTLGATHTPLPPTARPTTKAHVSRRHISRHTGRRGRSAATPLPAVPGSGVALGAPPTSVPPTAALPPAPAPVTTVRHVGIARTSRHAAAPTAPPAAGHTPSPGSPPTTGARPTATASPGPAVSPTPSRTAIIAAPLQPSPTPTP